MVFAIGSLASALAPGADALIIGRFIQGAGAAALGALALAMLTSSVPPGEIARIVGIWTAVSTASAAAGPLVGGILIETLSWRAVFFINVPFSALLFFVASRGLKEQVVSGKGGVGWIGAGLVTITLILITLGLGASESEGFLSVAVMLPLVVGLVLVGITAFQQRRTDTPLLDWSVLRSAPIPIALTLSVIIGILLAGALFELSILLQSILGFSAFMTGLVIMGASVALVIAAPIAGRIADRVGVGPVAATGLLIAAVGMFLLSTLSDDTEPWVVSMQLFVLGAGLGSALPSVSAAAMAAAGSAAGGSASGALAMSSQVASVLGVAIIGGITVDRIGAAWDASAEGDAALLVLRPEVVVGDLKDITEQAGAEAAEAAGLAFLAGVSEAFVIGALGLVVAAGVAAYGLRKRPTAGAD